MRKRTPNNIRFWKHVDRSSECWLWTGALLQSGKYGLFAWYDESRQKQQLRTAHRASYELAYGPIPEGQMVLHTCDNRACVKPEHLYLGTHTQNMQDMTVRGRAATGERNGKRLHPDRQPRGDTHPNRLHPERMARGERQGSAKLTAEQVQAMRARYDAGGILLRELAVEFGCPLSTVHQVVTRKTWRHI